MYPAITKRIWLLLVLFLFIPALLLGEIPPPAEQHFQKGLKYYLKGDNRSAAAELTQSLQADPGYAQAKALLAVVSGKKEKKAPVEIVVPADESIKIEPAKTDSSNLLSLELKNADINDVLRLFSQEYGYNIVAGKEVSGSVTISFVNVSVDDALRAILEVSGFGYEKVGNLTMVSTLANLTSRNHPMTANALITKVFTLNYISAEKLKSIIQKQLSPGGTVDVMTDLYIGGWEMSGVSTTQKDLGKKVREKAADEEKPKILVVTDLPAVVARLESLIEQLDVKPAQILIDAMIVEVGSQYVRDIGIDWDITKTSDMTYGFVSSPAATDQDFFTKGLTLGYENSPLTVTIRALETEGKANVLSNPRIMALDNYPAVIMVGERYPIMTTTTSTDATGKTIFTGSLDHYEPIGISLRVVPHVNKSGAVEMILHPEVTSLGDKVASGTGEGALILPRINSREADTNITVPNGQTVVIGGLLTNEKNDTYYKIPFLGDIPILGYLFKRTVNEPKKKELLIFITPHITNEPANAAELLQEKTSKLR